MDQIIYPNNTILDVVINSLGNPSIENIYAVLTENNITNLSPTLKSGNFLQISETLPVNSNVLNDIKNVYQTYPITDSPSIPNEDVQNLISNLENTLSLVPMTTINSIPNGISINGISRTLYNPYSLQIVNQNILIIDTQNNTQLLFTNFANISVNGMVYPNVTDCYNAIQSATVLFIK